jgi:hypothetical protein
MLAVMALERASSLYLFYCHLAALLTCVLPAHTAALQNMMALGKGTSPILQDHCSCIALLVVLRLCSHLYCLVYCCAALQNMFAMMALGKGTFFFPRDFWYAFKDYDGSPIDVKEHQDAYEFFTRLQVGGDSCVVRVFCSAIGLCLA